MKRFISMLLLCCMIVTSSGFMTACSANTTQNVKWKEWLSLVNSSFGMDSYLEEKPYIDSITADNSSFGDVQIAVEWDIIDANDDLDLEENVTLGEVLITLVNAGAFVANGSTDDEKIDYAIANFDDSIRKYRLDKAVDITTAITLLGTAQSKWANLTFEEATEEVTFKEGVVDGTKEDAKVEYKIDTNGDVLLSKTSNIEVKPGEIFVLPANAENFEVTTFKANTVTDEGDYVRINVSTDVSLEEVVEELYIAETLIPTSENTVIRDGNGNVIHVGNEVAGISSSEGNINADYSCGDAQQLKNVSAMSVKTEFEVDGWTIALKYNLDGKLDLEASIETDNMLNVSKSSNQELKGEASVELSNVKATPVFEFKGLKLKEASVRVDYDAKVSAGLKYSDKLVDNVLAPQYRNSSSKFLENLKTSVWKDKKTKGNGAKTIKICSVDVYSVGVARLCLDVNFTISAEGSASITVTESGTKGLEYKDGKLRNISDSKRDSDFELKAKVEATFGIGPALYTVGLKKSLIGASAEAGVGAAVQVTMHLVDQENHLIETIDASDMQVEDSGITQITITATAEDIKAVAESRGLTYTKEAGSTVLLHVDTCIDASLYFIVKIGLSNSYCKDLLADKVKISWSIVNEKNGKFAHLHSDNLQNLNVTFGIGQEDDLCTFNFADFDKSEETTETETQLDENISTEIGGTEESTQETTQGFGTNLVLSEMKTNMNVGDSYYIVISQYPEGYKQSDIIITSSDDSIVSVDKNGKVIAKETGSVVLTVSTKDGKFKAYCSVTVLMEENDEFI